jgi:type IV secretion system protein TrbB
MIYSLNPTIEAAIAALYRTVTPHLLDRTVQEVSANWDPSAKVSKVYVDRGIGTMEFVGELDPEAIVAVTLMLATEAGKSLDAEAGFLNCVLPNGCRYHAAISRVTDGPGFSIRLHHPREWKLSDFGMPGEQIAEVTNAVLDRKTILVAGGTFSGKTSYLNALIQLIPAEERLLVVEDELELQVREGNVVRRRATEGADLKRQVFEALRDRPDRIIVGEVRSAEAADMLEAFATGHAGGLSTIHANSANGAIKRLSRLARCDSELVHEAIDLIIFLTRRGERRTVNEIKYLHLEE